MPNNSVSDLVRVVDHLLRRKSVSPGIKTLKSLFDAIYFASLKNEEGHPLQLRVVFVDPANPDPGRPPMPRPSRWRITKLSAPLPLTVPALTKLARAADPWSSSIATYVGDDSGLFIWGLVDQAVHFNTMLVHESGLSYPLPGIFQVLTNGAADLSVYREYEFVARLAQDALVKKQTDIFFTEGPILTVLEEPFERHLESVWKRVERSALPTVRYGDTRESIRAFREDHIFDTADAWFGTLSRLLISIQRYRHGGALLLTSSVADLDIKYRITYSRLRTALVKAAAKSIEKKRVRHIIHSNFLDKNSDDVPLDLYLRESIAAADTEEYNDEVTGCVRFISSLSCVDGLVLATPDFTVRGFGVEIRTTKEIADVYLSTTASAEAASLRKVSSSHYGTRHRSMMRYCYAHPQSIGFVVSQDGDIRAMRRVGTKLVVWENPKVLSFWTTLRSGKSITLRR